MPFTNCNKCRAYNKGQGTKDCFKCDKYKEAVASIQARPQLRVEFFPQVLIEEVADMTATDSSNILKLIRGLPLETRAVILLKYYGGMTIAEMEAILKLGHDTIERRTKEALRDLKINLSGL